MRSRSNFCKDWTKDSGQRNINHKGKWGPMRVFVFNSLLLFLKKKAITECACWWKRSKKGSNRWYRTEFSQLFNIWAKSGLLSILTAHELRMISTFWSGWKEKSREESISWNKKIMLSNSNFSVPNKALLEHSHAHHLCTVYDGLCSTTGAQLNCYDRRLYVTFSLIPILAQCFMNHNDRVITWQHFKFQVYCHTVTLNFLIINAKGDKMDL